MADLREEARDLDLDVLLGQHVLAGRPGRLRQTVEEVGVHVGPDPEGEDPQRPPFPVPCDLGEDLVLVRGADRGPPVREEHDQVRSLALRLGLGRSHGGGERLVDRRSPNRLERRHELEGALAVRLRGGNQTLEEGLWLRREAHQLEAVVGVQVGEAEAERALGLLELAALCHRPGSVEHEHDVLRDHAGRTRRRGGQEQEVAVGPVFAVAEQAEADLRAGCGREEELEVGVGRNAFGLPGDQRARGAVALDLDLVRGRIEGLERILRLERHRNGDSLDRPRGEAFGVEGIEVLDEAALGAQDLRVAELDALLRMGLDREDPEPEEALPGVFKERRIAHPPDDVLVDRARPHGVEELRLGHLPVHVHRQLVDLGVLRDREEVGPLEAPVGRVHEDLVDLGGRHLAVDADGDVVVLHLEGREGGVPGWHQAGLLDHDQAVAVSPRTAERKEKDQNAADPAKGFEAQGTHETSPGRVDPARHSALGPPRPWKGSRGRLVFRAALPLSTGRAPPLFRRLLLRVEARP